MSGSAKSHAASPPRALSSARGMAKWGYLPALGLILVIVVLPTGLILKDSFEGGIESYVWAVTNGPNRTVLANTFKIATVVTIVSIVAGYPYAYAMTVVGPKVRLLLTAIVLIPFWTSVTVRSFAWIAILDSNGLLNTVLGYLGLPPWNISGTSAAVTVGMSQILLPFAVLPMFAVMARIDRRLVLAAQTLGASPARSFLRVYLPVSAPGILAGAILVFVMSLGFFITPALLGSPRETMIAVLIQAQVGSLLDWGRGGALAMLLLLITLMILLTGWLLNKMLSRGTAPR